MQLTFGKIWLISIFILLMLSNSGCAGIGPQPAPPAPTPTLERSDLPYIDIETPNGRASVDQPEVCVHDTIVQEVEGFKPGERIFLFFVYPDGTEHSTEVHADDTGHYAQFYPVGENLEGGRYRFFASNLLEGDERRYTNAVEYTIINPKLNIEPIFPSGRASPLDIKPVEFEGWGFTPGYQANVSIRKIPWVQLNNCGLKRRLSEAEYQACLDNRTTGRIDQLLTPDENGTFRCCQIFGNAGDEVLYEFRDGRCPAKEIHDQKHFAFSSDLFDFIRENQFMDYHWDDKTRTGYSVPAPDPVQPTPTNTRVIPETPPEEQPTPGAPPLNGERIAFVSDRDGNWEIYVMNVDGSGQTNLTNHPANDRSPAWSPDGMRLAFVSNRGHSDKTHVYVMNADGSEVINLTGNLVDYASDPAWSPDGTRIALVSRSEQPVFRGIYGDEYSQDVYVINIDGSGLTNLTSKEYKGTDQNPAWSPDGNRLVFTRQHESAPHYDNFSLYVMNADGSGGGIPKIFPERGTSIYKGLAAGHTPAWSPDGTRIAYSHYDRSQGEITIYTMKPDGSGETPLIEYIINFGPFPAWSPDGTRLAFSDNNGGNDEIYVINTDGSNRTNLTNNPAYDSEPAWSSAPGGIFSPISVLQTPPTAIPIPPPEPEQTDNFMHSRQCADFATQAEAQQFFLAAGGPMVDIYDLDLNGDGMACNEPSATVFYPYRALSSDNKNNCDGIRLEGQVSGSDGAPAAGTQIEYGQIGVAGSVFVTGTDTNGMYRALLLPGDDPAALDKRQWFAYVVENGQKASSTLLFITDPINTCDSSASIQVKIINWQRE